MRNAAVMRVIYAMCVSVYVMCYVCARVNRPVPSRAGGAMFQYVSRGPLPQFV